jgi:hypothetical protein
MSMYVYDPESELEPEPEPEPEPYSDKMLEPEPSSNFPVPQPCLRKQMRIGNTINQTHSLVYQPSLR